MHYRGLSYLFPLPKMEERGIPKWISSDKITGKPPINPEYIGYDYVRYVIFHRCVLASMFLTLVYLFSTLIRSKLDVQVSEVYLYLYIKYIIPILILILIYHIVFWLLYCDSNEIKYIFLNTLKSLEDKNIKFSQKRSMHVYAYLFFFILISLYGAVYGMIFYMSGMNFNGSYVYLAFCSIVLPVCTSKIISIMGSLIMQVVIFIKNK